jgi:hypothetical protein
MKTFEERASETAADRPMYDIQNGKAASPEWRTRICRRLGVDVDRPYARGGIRSIRLQSLIASHSFRNRQTHDSRDIRRIEQRAGIDRDDLRRRSCASNMDQRSTHTDTPHRACCSLDVHAFTVHTEIAHAACSSFRQHRCDARGRRDSPASPKLMASRPGEASAGSNHPARPRLRGAAVGRSSFTCSTVTGSVKLLP